MASSTVLTSMHEGAVPRRRSWPWATVTGLLPLLPAMLFLCAFFVVPAGVLFVYSVLTQGENGAIGLPLTVDHYVRIFSGPLYLTVLGNTLRISALTCIFCVLLGFPVAMAVVRGSPLVRRLVMLIIVTPLLVSIVVRTYGWQLILANGPTGVVNSLLRALGMEGVPLRVMYSETAVVIASVHVFLPMFVLPLASSLARIPPALEEAASTLGAAAHRIFWRVTLPLCIPGFVAGMSLVFALTASSYVTPAILGGPRGQMLGTLIEQQVLTAYDWTFASAVAVLLVVTVLVANGAAIWLVERRLRRRRRLGGVG